MILCDATHQSPILTSRENKLRPWIRPSERAAGPRGEGGGAPGARAAGPRGRVAGPRGRTAVPRGEGPGGRAAVPRGEGGSPQGEGRCSLWACVPTPGCFLRAGPRQLTGQGIRRKMRQSAFYNINVFNLKTARPSEEWISPFICYSHVPSRMQWRTQWGVDGRIFVSVSSLADRSHSPQCAALTTAVSRGTDHVYSSTLRWIRQVSSLPRARVAGPAACGPRRVRRVRGRRRGRRSDAGLYLPLADGASPLTSATSLSLHVRPPRPTCLCCVCPSNHPRQWQWQWQCRADEHSGSPQPFSFGPSPLLLPALCSEPPPCFGLLQILLCDILTQMFLSPCPRGRSLPESRPPQTFCPVCYPWKPTTRLSHDS